MVRVYKLFKKYKMENIRSITVWSKGQEFNLTAETYANQIANVKAGIETDLQINGIDDLVKANIVTTEDRTFSAFGREIKVVSYKLHLNDVNLLTCFNEKASDLVSRSIELVNIAKNESKESFDKELNAAKEDYIAKQIKTATEEQVTTINQSINANANKVSELDESFDAENIINEATNDANATIDAEKKNM